MPPIPSISSSSDAQSKASQNIGPTTFGNVSISSGAGSSAGSGAGSPMLILAGVAILAVLFFLKK